MLTEYHLVGGAGGSKQAVRVVLGGYGGTPSGDPKERLRATEWLHSFQRRDDAWDSCVAGMRLLRYNFDFGTGCSQSSADSGAGVGDLKRCGT